MRAFPRRRRHRMSTNRTSTGRQTPHVHLPQRGGTGRAAGVRAHPLPAGRRRPPLPRQRQHRRLHPRRRAGRAEGRGAGQDAGGAARAGDRHRERPQHATRPPSAWPRCIVDEVFRGRYVPMPAVTEFPNAERLNELMIVGPITVRSACSHHLCPIFGKVWIGLLPNEHSNLIGLSQIRAHRRLDHEPAADPGRGGDDAGQRTAASACAPTAWPS